MKEQQYEQWDGEVYTGNYSFDIQQSLDKSIFKWQDLAGKELLIKVGHYPDELGKGDACLCDWSGQN